MIAKNKCEGCGGTLIYDPDKNGLYCENCGSTKTIQTNLYAKTKFLTQDSMAQKKEGVDLNVKCESCGASLTSGDIVDTKCPYCGSNQINAVNEGLEYVPDSIIPFTISKRKATGLLKIWLKKRKFAPNDLKKKANVNSLQGLYFPCWLYDYETYTRYQGIGVREYRDSDGDTHVTRTRISGDVSGKYQNQIEPASSALQEMSIEQFRDYANIQQHEYDSGYLLGFSTANLENDVVNAFTRERSQKSVEIEENIKKKLNYDRYENFVTQTNFTNVMWSYTLLPVWFAEYKYKEKSYKILVNGRTGTVIGKAPKSFWKIFFLVIGIILGVGGIAALVAMAEMGMF